MAQGRLRAERAHAIAQAAVLFFQGSDEDLAQFIRTGALDAGRRDVMPCSTVMLEAMQRATEKRRGGKR